MMIYMRVRDTTILADEAMSVTFFFIAFDQEGITVLAFLYLA